MKPLSIIGPDADGRYNVVLAELKSLDGGIRELSDLMTRAMDVLKDLDPCWCLTSGVQTLGLPGPGLAIYVQARRQRPAWVPADNGGGQGKPS